MTQINKVAIAVLVALPLAFGQQAEKSKAEPKAEPKAKTTVSVPASAQGLVVVKDADGGIRQATPEEIGKLNPSNLLLDAVTGSPTVKADGSRSVRLGVDQMNFVVVTKTPDGKLVTSEVVGEKQANELVNAPAQKAASKGEVK